MVDAAYAAAMEAGATDEGAPGVRTAYSAGYYGAYCREPEGNKIHFVHRPGFEAVDDDQSPHLTGSSNSSATTSPISESSG